MQPSLYETFRVLQATHWWFLARQRFLDVLLRPVDKGGRVLDAGCGPGSMLHYFGTYGQVTGLDGHLPALQMARSHFQGELVQGTVECLPFNGRRFSLVSACEVLYHRNVKDVSGTIVELVRVLEPGGWLLVVDSAYSSLTSEHDEAAHGVRRFTKEMLVAEFRAAGLEVVRATYAYSLLLPIVWLVRRWKALRPNPNPRPELQPVAGLLNSMLICWFAIEAQIAGRCGLPWGFILADTWGGSHEVTCEYCC